MQLSFRNTCFLALAAMSCLVASQALAAAPNVSYMASGIFTTRPFLARTCSNYRASLSASASLPTRLQCRRTMVLNGPSTTC